MTGGLQGQAKSGKGRILPVPAKKRENPGRTGWGPLLGRSSTISSVSRVLAALLLSVLVSPGRGGTSSLTSLTAHAAGGGGKDPDLLELMPKLPPLRRGRSGAPLDNDIPGFESHLAGQKRKREDDASAVMFSTKAKSAAKRAWLALERDLSKRPGWMVSTDGSSTGWHSAVLVGPPGADMRLRARWADMKGTRNVGAEASGFLLGIESLPSAIPSCMCLGDFLNALAFDAGTANFKHPVLVDVYGRVEAEKRARFPAGLAITHVHHPGHQTDASYFTWLNRCADSLAGLGREVDVLLPESELEELAAGPKSFAARLERAELEALTGVPRS